MNIQTALILILLLVVIYFAVRHVRKTKGCDCGCGIDDSHCGGCSGCHH
ncbi:hypothetical protein [Anaerosphaera multitolerans]|nr:hypothetical protein [Anaerosphaera multitolerans]